MQEQRDSSSTQKEQECRNCNYFDPKNSGVPVCHCEHQNYSIVPPDYYCVFHISTTYYNEK